MLLESHTMLLCQYDYQRSAFHRESRRLRLRLVMGAPFWAAPFVVLSWLGGPCVLAFTLPANTAALGITIHIAACCAAARRA